MTVTDDRLPNEESEAASIVRRFTLLGYHPSPRLEADRVCFYKDFSDDEGRRARIHVYFDKPILGMTALRLANIVISTQVVVQATAADIKREAPAPLRDDLSRVLESFSEYLTIPEQAVVTRVCIKCGKAKPRFYVINTDAVCLECVEARRTGP